MGIAESNCVMVPMLLYFEWKSSAQPMQLLVVLIPDGPPKPHFSFQPCRSLHPLDSINLHIYFWFWPTLKDALLANVTHYSLVELDSLVWLQRLRVQLTEYASYLWESIWATKVATVGVSCRCRFLVSWRYSFGHLKLFAWKASCQIYKTC